MLKTSKMIVPNFIVIGPGKSGTTWLYQILKEHPDVGMSSAKETLFFEDFYDRGIKWYSKFFTHCQNCSVVGEASNTYIFSPIASKRILDFNPDIKIITTLRNPIERAYSHYLFLCRNGEKIGAFEDAIESQGHLLERGLYFFHLSKYYEIFNAEQILALIYDDLKHDSHEYATKLFEFLDVRSDLELPSLSQKILVASEARNKLVAMLVKQLALAVRKTGYPELIESVKSSFIPKLLYSPIKSSESIPKMQLETREFLRQYYRKDVEELSILLGRDFISLWIDAQ
jgi:hypothetical protein